MVDAGDETKGASKFGLVRRELFWVAPLAVATLAVTGLLLLVDPSTGIGFANILAVPIGIVGVGVAVLAIRLANQPQMSGGEFQGRPSLARASSVVAISLAVVFFFIIRLANFFWPSHDSLDYLKGRTVKIGVNGNLPGWSYGSGKGFDGFDIDVANFLADRIGFVPKFIPLNPGRREDALASGEVDLVIASYSITHERERNIDFAGPYFLDEAGIFLNTGKGKKKGQTVCFTEGTTAQDNLKADLVNQPYKPESEGTVERCLSRFFQQDDRVVGIATDKSILEAFKGKSRKEAKLDVVGENREEKIGVGMPNNSPNLCGEISKLLNSFMTSKWKEAFNDNLAPLGVKKDGQNPSSTSLSHCRTS
ncbi:transporter substrate-binding domain-containing protein [Streptosporangium canum]|uniref:transporter substrate-binding domain-containing protein n=1 Tax=Streptosporangium canum TaxID=324952 RepID=UPI0033B2DD7F